MWLWKSSGWVISMMSCTLLSQKSVLSPPAPWKSTTTVLILLHCVNRNSAKETREEEEKHLHLTSECTWSWFGSMCMIYFACTQSELQWPNQNNYQKGLSISISFDFNVSWPSLFTSKFICRYVIYQFCLRRTWQQS